MKVISQPELGHKISDLRKKKGLTQEELVERCNISVRTLQRIEAGEVSPRPVTLKLIFDALDIPIEESLYEDKKNWTEKFALHFRRIFIEKPLASLSVIFFMAFVVGGLWLFREISRNDKNLREHETLNRSHHQINDKQELEITSSGMWKDNHVIIGRDVSFTYEGVRAKFSLLKLNTKTMEFSSTLMKGVILPNKVNIQVEKNQTGESKIHSASYGNEQSGPIGVVNGGVIILKGGTVLTTVENDTIEADEIHVTEVDKLYVEFPY